MRERSQIDDMRAAIRGDIERAQARREADPWRAQEPETVVEEPSDSEGRTQEGSVPAERAEKPAPEPEPVTEVPEEVTEPATSPPQPTTESAAQARTPGFFARLFGRG